MNKIFIERIREYFKDDADRFLNLLDEKATQGLFLNTKKANKDEILSLIDFEYKQSEFTDESFYHCNDNIGKTKAYELGLIYPQEIAASLSTKFIDKENIKTVVDMCAAPGGKTINIINRLNDEVLCISNDVNHTRALILSSNIERLGLDNVIVTNKTINNLAQQLENWADLVILDAPCSGEGIIRKYPEIIDEYSLDRINELSILQKELLEYAYLILTEGGQLVYSTCTYSHEEDEDQIIGFLERHPDMHMVMLPDITSSELKGTIKLSPLNNTEGQFICLMRKDGNKRNTIIELPTIKNKLIDSFIKDNIDINDYYLYEYNNHYYLSLKPLPDLKSNVLRYGIYLGDIKNKRFEPSYSLYRANSLKGKFKYTYDLSDDEYDKYVGGLEIKANLNNAYYQITYKNHSLGFGKCSNGVIKNKYPKGLRRMI